MNRIFVIAVIALLSFSYNESSAKEFNPSNNLEISAAKKKKVKVVYTTAITCEKCVTKIKENIGFMRGIKDLDVFIPTQRVEVVYDPAKTDETKIVNAFKKIGYTVKKVKVEEKKK